MFPVNFASKFSLTSNDSLGHDVVYAIFDSMTMAAPADTDVSIDQPNGEVTTTPPAGFHGQLHLSAAVRDVESPNLFANYPTDAFTVDVIAPPLDPVANHTTVT